MSASFITAAPPQQPQGGDLRWTSAAVLVALAERGLKAGDSCTSRQLRAWVPQLRTGQRLKHAAETLSGNGYLKAKPGLDAKTGVSFTTYTITSTGAEAVKAAAAGKQLKSGPKGPHGQDRAVPPTTFAARLWALMRARGMLDTDTAAATLVDAGGDVATAAKTAQRYFARWASTGALAESAQRLPGGRKRYVLVKDCGPNPPAWTPKAQARRAAPDQPTTTAAS